jgi:hypothetical protein
MARHSMGLASAVIAASLIPVGGCGGGGSAPVGPLPPTTLPTPAPTPAPTPTPDAFDCNVNSYAEGPVASFRIKVRIIRKPNGSIISGPPEGDLPKDALGRVMVERGDFVVMDGTQKNAGNQPCRWQNDPVWRLTDPSGVLSVRSSSRETSACGFLLRTDVERAGVVTVDASLDGIEADTAFDREPEIVLIAK